MELETNSKMKNIRDFKKGYQPRSSILKMRRVIGLQTPTVFWLRGGTFLSPAEHTWG
jgi:hypothetical protein